MGNTTQRADYIPFGDGRREGYKPTSSLPNQPFDGTTTYKCVRMGGVVGTHLLCPCACCGFYVPQGVVAGVMPPVSFPAGHGLG